MAKYYYNGVLLPEIPADVLAQYPYAWINATADLLVVAGLPWYYETNYKKLNIPKSSQNIKYILSATGDEWVYSNSWTDTGGYQVTNGITWSSHDIPNGSATATAIYFYSTYPIPEADECYYNGVRLPAIPADVLAQYPMCVIYLRADGTTYRLLAGTKPWYIADGIYIEKSTYVAYDTIRESTSWTFVRQYTDDGRWGLGNGIKWSNHDIPNGSATSTTIYFYGNSPAAVEPETPTERTRGYLIRSGSTLYTITDGALTSLAETEITASLFQTYGVDEIPDGSLLVGLTDPEVLYWQDSEDELPALELTVKGTPPLPQMFTSDPIDLTHESIAGIDHAVVDASEDVRFAISFDDGVTWQAFDGSSWFNVSDTEPGMLASTMNAITAEQWAEVVVLNSYMVRFWLPNVTAFVKSVVIHYINP